MSCEKFTIIRHHTECSFPMQKWSSARLRYGIHFWWLHNAKGVGPGPIQEIRDCSFSFESLRSLQTAFSSQVDYLRVSRHPPIISSKLQIKLPTFPNRIRHMDQTA